MVKGVTRVVNGIQRPVVQEGWGAGSSVDVRGEWNVLGSWGLSFPGAEQPLSGKVWLQPEPTHRMSGGSVTKVMATPRGGPAGARAGAAVATHPEFRWSNAVGLKERVDAGCWLAFGVRGLYVLSDSGWILQHFICFSFDTF